MAETMIGLVKTEAGEGNMELRELPVPLPGPGQVQVEVQATGICGSDLHIYHSDIALAMRPPVVTGHEFAGTVTRLGEGVTGLSVGDRVSAITSFSTCGQCVNCRTGRTNICPEKRLIGYWYDGAFARYIVVPEGNLQRLPDGVGFREGAVVEPLACAVEAVVELTRVKPEDVVLVTGPGVIGQLTAQLARLCGGRVILAGRGRDAARLATGAALGAHRCVDGEAESLDDVVKELTGGAGADVVFECSGAAPAAQAGLRLLRRGGQFTQVGLFGKPIQIDFEQIAYKEARVTGSLGQRWLDWDRAMKLLRHGRVQVAPLISEVLPLARWKEGFDRLAAGQGIKILLEP